MKKLALLLVAALFVTLLTVSCSKKKKTTEEVKQFSFSEKVHLKSNTGEFSGSVANAEKLSSMNLMLKKDSKDDYERIPVQISKNKFTLTQEGLDDDTYKYYYEYVLDGSTKKTSKKSFQTHYPIMVVGRWKTEDEGYYEEYYANGDAKYWAPEEDIPEEDAIHFTWYFDINNKLTQLHPMQTGTGVIPQYCNVIILNETTFKYDNNAARREYDLIRDIE